MIWPFKRETRNAATIASSDPYLAEWFSLRGQGPSAVNPETLLSNSAVAVRCVNIRSEMLASVGLFPSAPLCRWRPGAS